MANWEKKGLKLISNLDTSKKHSLCNAFLINSLKLPVRCISGSYFNTQYVLKLLIFDAKVKMKFHESSLVKELLLGT